MAEAVAAGTVSIGASKPSRLQARLARRSNLWLDVVMDRFRSVQYFLASAQCHSFLGAARRLQVSQPAVTKGVQALEADLGVVLFERHARGLRLTAAGNAYATTCSELMAQWAQADAQLRAGPSRTEGLLVLSVPNMVAERLLAPVLPRFHALYPRITLELCDFDPLAEREGVDLYLHVGWHRCPDLIERALAGCSFWLVASPAYLAEHGVPVHPHDLAAHQCLRLRGPSGVLMDQWQFERAGEILDVTVGGWLMASNNHRGTVNDMLGAGLGLARAFDWAVRDRVAQGSLVRVLADWHCLPIIPLTLAWKPAVRRLARVRALIDFLTELAADLDRKRGGQLVPSAPPEHWPAQSTAWASTLATQRGRRRAQQAGRAEPSGGTHDMLMPAR